MNRGFYYLIITIMTGVLAVPVIVNVVFSETIIPDISKQYLVKPAFLFFIAIAETSLIKQRTAKIFASICIVSLFVGWMFKIMHWPLALEMLVGSGVLLYLLLLVMAIVEKNKGLLHYLLFIYMLLRIAVILNLAPSIFWTIDVVFSLILMLGGLSTLMEFKHFKKR